MSLAPIAAFTALPEIQQIKNAYMQGQYVGQSSLAQLQSAGLTYKTLLARKEKILNMEVDLILYLHRNDTIKF